MLKLHDDIWIYSDPHFNHKRILAFSPCRAEDMLVRGYDNHESWMADRINEVVGEEESLCLGDFAFGGIEESINNLSGKKHIILGNHDRKPHTYEMRNMTPVRGIQLQVNDARPYVREYDDPLISAIIWIRLDGVFVFSHYPIINPDKHTVENERQYKRVLTLREAVSEIIDPREANYIHGHVHSLKVEHKWSRCVSIEQLPNMQPMRIGDIINEF
jgi:calcineurin-like phosphoesterase family protein